MRIARVSTEEDLSNCIALRREVFVAEQGVPIEEEVDEQDDLAVGHHVYVADESGHVVATARYQAYDEKTAKIQRVAVRLAVRGAGYGRLVMDAIEHLAYADGYRRAILDAQCHAEAFYQRLGYRTVSDETFYDAGILHVRMEKDMK